MSKKQFSKRQFVWSVVTAAAVVFVFGRQVGESCADEQPTLSDGFTPQEISVPEGFVVELAAGPPLVKHPTFATFDDRGRLFVCENAGVNMSAEELEENLPNSIRLLEDTDCNGQFDKSTLFADKMTFPMGGAWHDGALYVASPPSIWRLEDTTGDGVADRREVIVHSFGYTGNAASIHGCFLGPDGRLYWCDGYHGHEFKDEAGNITSKREGSYIFSCKSDGSDVRIFCGGGMDNPVEIDFTDEGELLGTVNIFYTRPRVDCLVHWLHGGAYPHREMVLKELKVTGELLGPVHQFGHVAVSGTMQYRSGALDHRWCNDQFATIFNSGKVVRLELERDGATFRATPREFLSLPSREFHPTDVVEDADGSLLVVDTGGWFYRGCPTSQHAKPEIQGAIYRVRRSDMTTPIDPWGLRIGWSKQTPRQLSTLLKDTRLKVRERAIAECAARGGSMVPVLQEIVQHGDLMQRRSATWALTRIVGRNLIPSNQRRIVQAAIRMALNDRHPSVRLVACRSLSTYPDLAAQGRLLEMLQADEPPIRREAATALGRMRDMNAVPALLAALSADIDRTEAHSIVYSLIEINDPVTTRFGLNAKNSDTRRGALVALDQMAAGNLTAGDVAQLMATDNVSLQQAAANVFSRHADWSKRAAEVLARMLAIHGSAEQIATPIRRLTTTFLAEPTVGKLIGSVLNDTDTNRPTRDLLLAAIAEGRAVPLHENWGKTFDRLLGADETETLAATLSAVAAIKTDRFRSHLERIGSDPSRPPLLRVTALQIASGQQGSLTDGALELLFKLLDSSFEGGSPNESLQAAQKIGASELRKPQLLRLAPKLTDAA
ncbi:MAG: PVC-type heme-binding CxxCH protein, partial [Aeoliella sp.]